MHIFNIPLFSSPVAFCVRKFLLSVAHICIYIYRSLLHSNFSIIETSSLPYDKALARVFALSRLHFFFPSDYFARAHNDTVVAFSRVGAEKERDRERKSATTHGTTRLCVASRRVASRRVAAAMQRAPAAEEKSFGGRRNFGGAFLPSVSSLCFVLLSRTPVAPPTATTRAAAQLFIRKLFYQYYFSWIDKKSQISRKRREEAWWFL